jgi:N utilization substance protein B
MQSIDNAQDLYLLVLSIFEELKTKELEYLDKVSKKH